MGQVRRRIARTCELFASSCTLYSSAQQQRFVANRIGAVPVSLQRLPRIAFLGNIKRGVSTGQEVPINCNKLLV